ncbi:MAG: putative lipid II flippase FtsW [Planctomycetota bacterium]
MKTEPRYLVLVAVTTLLAMGTIFVFSSTVAAKDPLWIITRHIGSVLIGLLLMWGLSRLDYRKLRGQAWSNGLSVPFLLGILSVLLLIAVLIFGIELNGANRWFKIGPITFQPSEIAKIALIVFFADFFCRKQARVREFWYGFAPAVVLSSICLTLIAIEPDLGTAVLLGTVILFMLITAGFRMVHILPSLVVALVVGTGVMLRFPHVWKRLGTFISGEYDFQVSQALIAIGSGGVAGSGLGDGVQKLKYVPLAQSDFAFAVVGEESGFIGCLLLLICFAVFAWFGMKIAQRANDLFGRLLAVGITSLITLQAIINLYVVTGIGPNKGIPLPFISAGGSAMVLLLAGVGLLLAICRTTQNEELPGVVGGKLTGGRLTP